jgi:hypothetical protein
MIPPLCPHCGRPIDDTQGELPLGPIEIYRKKKLDVEIGDSLKSNGSIRFDHSLNEAESLIDSIRLVVGEHEMELNGPLWRSYCRTCPDAMRYSIRKWNALEPIQRRSVKHPPAWLTDFYKRAQKAFTKARKTV